jgi:hypothetical protein
MKLDVKAFGLTCGLLWGMAVFILPWWIILFEGPTGEVPFLGRIYRGYDMSLLGSFIGLGWALVDGFVGGAMFAWIYNRIASHDSRNGPPGR